MNASILLASLNLILGGLVFLLGLVILRENPRQRLNRAVAFMLFFGGLGSIVTAIDFVGPQATPEETLEGGFLPAVSQNFSYLWEFFFPTLLVFASVFPRERGYVRRVRSFEVLVYLPHAFHFLLLFGLTFAGARIEALDLAVPDLLRPFASLLELVAKLFLAIHTTLFSLVNLGYGVASAALLWVSYRQTRVPKLRQQLRVIGGGMVVGLALYSSSSLIPPLFNIPLDKRIQALLTVAGLTVISAGIAYSMVRYKFLDTRLLARRGILYAVASAIVVGIYLVVLDRVNQLMGTMLGIPEEILEPMLLIVALILFQPVIGRLEELLEQLFLGDPGDYRNVIRRLGRDLLTNIDLEASLNLSVETLAEAMLLRSSYVVALHSEGPLVFRGSGHEVGGAALQPLPALLAALPHDVDSVRVLSGDDDTLGEEANRYLVQTFDASLIIPLHSKGELVGAMILGEKVTGTEYTSEDVALLADLARQMSVSIQNGLLLRERVAVARLEEELTLARDIQSRFLPQEFPTMERLEVYGSNTPSREVGGDFYDLVPATEGSFLLAIADVSGKGMGAALLTSMLQAALRTQAESEPSVGRILSNINALLHRSIPMEQFVTFFLARVDENTLRMTYSNGGHNYPFISRPEGNRVFLERGGMILGMFDEGEWEEEEIQLVPGDRVVFYTDGINEALNAAEDEYTEERLYDLVSAMPADLSAQEITERILEDHRGFLAGVEPQDDVTLVVLRVLEPKRAPRGTGSQRRATADQTSRSNSVRSAEKS